MRRLLIAAVAAAPLLLAAGAAYGQTTVSASTSTPLATSAKGDIDVAVGGTISANTATPLITLDSSNKVTIEGALQAVNTDNAIGVLILGGNTGSLTHTGSITISEDYTATDSANGDGILEAPFATGTGKRGVLLSGASAFNGDLNLGGTIVVKGNSSYGVSIEAPLNGTLGLSSTMTVTGDAVAGLRVLAPVSGFISTGVITTAGAAAKSIDLQAAAGSLRLYGAVTNTGYSTTTRPTALAALAKVQATPLDLQQSGAAVTVGASLANGFFLATAPSGTVSGALADADGDGVADGSETAGSITNYGSAPALLIGAAGKAVTLGQVSTGDAAYGLIVRGAILGSGIYDGVTATGAQIGNGGTVAIAGGVRVTGSITGRSYEADATAVHILSGTTTPLLRNDGYLTGSVLDSTATAGLGGASARALLIDAGASLPSLLNSGAGVIAASTVGNTGLTAAIVDQSGTLASVLNEGSITAQRASTETTTAVTGQAIALDLRANTTGVTLVQQVDTTSTITYGTTSGTTDTATVAGPAPTPSITGDVLLGSGPNVVDLEAGTLTGALSLGSNTASLTINGGATYAGALRYTGSKLALAITSGTLTQREATTLQLSSLTLGSSAALNLAVDAVNGKASLLQTSGAATIANGAKIGVQLLSTVTTPQTYTLISSPSLTVASSDSDLLASSSFLVTAALHSNVAAGTVTVTLTPRTAADLGLSASEGTGLAAVVDGAAKDSAVSVALLGTQDSGAFAKLYRQLLPEHGNGVFHAVDQASRAIADLSTGHNDLFKPGSPDGGVWMEQFLLGSRETGGAGPSSETGGYGLVAGATTSDSTVGAFGVTAAYVNASSNDPDLTGANSASFSQFEGGLTWRTAFGGLEIAAHGGGGYLWGVTRRQFLADATTLTSAVSRSTKGTWNGWTADARVSLAYRIDLGSRFFVQPQASFDYVRVEQAGYTERFGGDGLNLTVADRSSSAASVTGSVLFGGKFGQTGAIRPTFEVGVRDVFSGDAGPVSASYAAGGSSFALSSTPITGAGGLAKVGLKYAGTFVDVELAAKAQAFDRYQEGDLKVAISTRF